MFRCSACAPASSAVPGFESGILDKPHCRKIWHLESQALLKLFHGRKTISQGSAFIMGIPDLTAGWRSSFQIILERTSPSCARALFDDNSWCDIVKVVEKNRGSSLYLHFVTSEQVRLGELQLCVRT
jgi:hypothetical protein